MAYTLLALGGLSLSINPNFWTLVNAMQIMRTITLLKINMPLSIRNIIKSATELGGLDISFNIFDVPIKEQNKVKYAIENDPVLTRYYIDYGIEEYKHWSYIKQQLAQNIVPIVLIFVVMIVKYIFFLIRKKKEKRIKAW